MTNIPDTTDITDADAILGPIDTVAHSAQFVQSVSLGKNNEIEKIMSQALNLSDKRTYHEPTCLICSSPYRDELEKKYSEKVSFKDVVDLFKQKTGEEISEDLVKNHIELHLTSGVREQHLMEYINKVKRLNAPSLTTLDKISMAYAVILERVLGINSLVASGDESVSDIEKIKTDGTAKLMSGLNNLLKLQASILGEMKTSGELVYIPTNEFVTVFREAMRSAKTEREQALITSILDKLEALARRTQ